MKRYKHPISQEWYYEGQSITTFLEEGTVFTGIPSEEMLKEWGFEEYITPEYVPSEEDKIRARMNEILNELRNTDYIVLKAFEGEDVSLYGDWKTKRKTLREEYNILEKKLSEREA